ncbi:hypothetical protein B9Z19DRAFT_1095538 [Tuber borchii]|uniref:Uncharacterized protein n=1 Tax=Tuber borchii TaxID=42251 RepID=A0A2T6ZCJ9_TUBBO|nr:hypothetical protein B9Z19DRAFT_1095538 [Tuber borchii]
MVQYFVRVCQGKYRRIWPYIETVAEWGVGRIGVRLLPVCGRKNETSKRMGNQT